MELNRQFLSSMQYSPQVHACKPVRWDAWIIALHTYTTRQYTKCHALKHLQQHDKTYQTVSNHIKPLNLIITSKVYEDFTIKSGGCVETLSGGCTSRTALDFFVALLLCSTRLVVDSGWASFHCATQLVRKFQIRSTQGKATAMP